MFSSNFPCVCIPTWWYFLYRDEKKTANLIPTHSRHSREYNFFLHHCFLYICVIAFFFFWGFIMRGQLMYVCLDRLCLKFRTNLSCTFDTFLRYVVDILNSFLRHLGDICYVQKMFSRHTENVSSNFLKMFCIYLVV